MGANIWSEKVLKAGEDAITRVVNRILSTSFVGPGRKGALVQQVLDSLELPTREEAEALREEVSRLRQQVEQLSARLSEGGSGSCRNTP